MLQKLDDALASQQQQMMSTERQLKVLTDQLRKLEAVMPGSDFPDDEKPPHY